MGLTAGLYVRGVWPVARARELLQVCDSSVANWGQHPLPPHCTYSEERRALHFFFAFRLYLISFSLRASVVTLLRISRPSRLFYWEKGLLFSKLVAGCYFWCRHRCLLSFFFLPLSLSLCIHQNTIFNHPDKRRNGEKIKDGKLFRPPLSPPMYL